MKQTHAAKTQRRRLVQYRRPLSRLGGGGWYYGYALDHEIDDNGQGIWIIQPVASGQHLRIHEEDVQEVTR